MNKLKKFMIGAAVGLCLLLIGAMVTCLLVGLIWLVATHIKAGLCVLGVGFIIATGILAMTTHD